MNLCRGNLRTALPRKQRGVGTLLISLVILTTITFILLYSARTVLTETQLAGNDHKGREAFEAAEAGQEAAAAYISTPGGRDKNLDGNIDVIYDTDGDGVGDTDTLTLDNGARVTVTLQNVVNPDLPIVGTRVTSKAWNEDRTAYREIDQLYAFVSPLPNLPTNPLLTRSTLVVGGSATVINPEGHSTIWSGGPVNLGGNNTTSTMIADPSRTTADPTATPPTGAYPDCLGARSLDGSGQCAVVRSSDRYTPGLDILEQDTSLANLSADEFFLNFFGMTQQEYRNDMVTIMTTPANSTQSPPVGAMLATDEVVWVDGGGPGGTETQWGAGFSAGCSVAGSSNAQGIFCNGNIQPTILVVDGDLRVNGNVTIWGLLYVTGNVTGSGSVDVVGAVMMQGDNSGLNGGLRVVYNSEVLRSMADNGPVAAAGGTWRDF